MSLAVKKMTGSSSKKSRFSAEKSCCTIMFTPALLICVFFIFFVPLMYALIFSMILLSVTYVECLILQVFLPEKPHVSFSRSDSEKIKQTFINNGFRLLKSLNQIKKQGQLWGVESIMDETHTLHIRDIHRNGESYLSAHLEKRRDNFAHLWTGSDYTTGGKILKKIISNWEVPLVI